MIYDGLLEFKGQWRNYQARVLANADRYLADNKIHIVAAPGSGKTTLGIELIRRLDGKALVLAPSITIREQWISRIKEAFLCEGCDADEYLSQDLKNPKTITVATYQALYSAMTRFRGKEENGEDDAAVAVEVDYDGFDLVKAMKNNDLQILCLDECHHLRSEWWKALEEFKDKLNELKVISLTATPPYDSTPSMWNRYMNMCGEIDEEITIPELVKDGSLCPHQDYVYFNYPTKEEEKEVLGFVKRAQEMLDELMKDDLLLSYVQTHKGINGMGDDDLLLDDPAYLSSILIYLQSRNQRFPARLQKLLGAKKLPDISVEWMERLMQGFLYDDADSYYCDNGYRESLIDKLKAQGLIEKRKVTMSKSAAVEKILTNSLGKCNSIRDIVLHEYDTSGQDLRLLVLTDYIRKEYEKAIGDEKSSVNALGVIPFFEMLRRENQRSGKNIRFGVLCGSVVIIPAEARNLLEQEVEDLGRINFSKIGHLDENDYLKVTAVGNSHFLTAAVTNIFAKGAMQVLIGTKSLLGEGWDSPCINSLILASFVGSFMLSNQMRGRAIRVWEGNQEKTSNIWHLVCLRPWSDVQKNPQEGISEDFNMLSRRMEHFMGLHYEEDVIENRMERMSIIKPPFNKGNTSKINKRMLKLSGERKTLKERWANSLSVFDKIDMVDENQVADKFVTYVHFMDFLRYAILGLISLVIGIVFGLVAAGKTGSFSSALSGFVLALGGMTAIICCVPKLFVLGNPLRRLEAFGKGIRKALENMNMLEEARCKVVAENKIPGSHVVYLAGGSGRDKNLFANCISEFFDEIDNQRYILVKKKGHKGINSFYAVPNCFAKRKEDAQNFAKCMKPYIGNYELVYTRNEKGRKLLLEGRVKALANRENRCIRKKKVKGALY